MCIGIGIGLSIGLASAAISATMGIAGAVTSANSAAEAAHATYDLALRQADMMEMQIEQIDESGELDRQKVGAQTAQAVATIETVGAGTGFDTTSPDVMALTASTGRIGSIEQGIIARNSILDQWIVKTEASELRYSAGVQRHSTISKARADGISGVLGAVGQGVMSVGSMFAGGAFKGGAPKGSGIEGMMPETSGVLKAPTMGPWKDANNWGAFGMSQGVAF